MGDISRIRGGITIAIIAIIALISISFPIAPVKLSKTNDSNLSIGRSNNSVITQSIQSQPLGYNVRGDAIIQNIEEKHTPLPTPTPILTVPNTSSGQVNKDLVLSYIDQKFGANRGVAECIARHESGLRSNAVHLNYNGTYDIGVFQINDVHGLSWDYRMDYIKNIDYAYMMSGGGVNWAAWTTAKYCL